MVNFSTLAKISKILADYLSPCEKQTTKTKLVMLCIVIFLIALSIRLLYWQDHYLSLAGQWYGLGYDTQAERILSDGGILFPKEPVKLGDARIIDHPPGYSTLMAISFWLSNKSVDPLIFFQILCDSFTAVMIFLVALELLPFAVGIISATFVIFSPHFAYYSLISSPDSLVSLPALVAIYFIILAMKNFQIQKVAIAGIAIGISCWLRPNAMLLSPFLAIVLLPCFARKDWLKYGFVLVISTVLVILPITIRNIIVFHEFVPISIGVGINLIEGIADYDKEKRFGMPADDQEVALLDAVWYNRPEYKGNMWSPDGFERDRNRIKRGIEVIKKDPLWFFGIVLHRITFMLHYNDKGSRPWPFNTAIVPIIKAEAPFNHSLMVSSQAIWTASPYSLSTQGKLLSSQAFISLSDDKETLTLQGDNSAFNNQFISQSIKISKYTDYVLKITIKTPEEESAVKVLSADQNNTLASNVISPPKTVYRKKVSIDENKNQPLVISIPFASEKVDEIVVAFSNNGQEKPKILINKIELYTMGSTPYTWTHYPRLLIRAVQKNIYNTYLMLPLIIIGVFLVVGTCRKQLFLVLLAIPVYYFCLQSIIHTEYRYILAIHYFLFIISSCVFYVLGKLLFGKFLNKVKPS
jgi:hypothetical protein